MTFFDINKRKIVLQTTIIILVLNLAQLEQSNNMFSIFKSFKSKQQQPNEKQICKDTIQKQEEIKILIDDMNINPLKYIDYGYNRFITAINKDDLKQKYETRRVYYIIVSEWYNIEYSKYYENNTITPYITGMLNKRIVKYLEDNGFKVATNFDCEHNWLGMPHAGEDIILFGNPDIFENGDINKYVDYTFGNAGNFWISEKGFEGINVIPCNTATVYSW